MYESLLARSFGNFRENNILEELKCDSDLVDKWSFEIYIFEFDANCEQNSSAMLIDYYMLLFKRV